VARRRETVSVSGVYFSDVTVHRCVGAAECTVLLPLLRRSVGLHLLLCAHRHVHCTDQRHAVYRYSTSTLPDPTSCDRLVASCRHRGCELSLRQSAAVVNSTELYPMAIWLKFASAFGNLGTPRGPRRLRRSVFEIIFCRRSDSYVASVV